MLWSAHHWQCVPASQLPVQMHCAVSATQLSTQTSAVSCAHSACSYLWITIVYNVTYTLALYALLLFYLGTHDLLAPFKPMLKFLVVKSIVFMTFWQVRYLPSISPRCPLALASKSLPGWGEGLPCTSVLAAAALALRGGLRVRSV